MAVSLREVLSFGRYEPLFRIASGGMAEVYAAQIQGEAGFQKLVAVKRMHPHLAHDPSFVDMFLNEARLAAHIASPHVVQTLDLGRGSDGSLYIVMELVVGISLATLEVTLESALPVPVALELVAQAAQGLDDAHEAVTPSGEQLGLIHRDISPHNILVGLDGRARVTDFGIARAVHAPRAETNAKELKGKFAYMSPEQTRMHPLDRRSDLFSLGIVLWEALVGKRLFAVRDPAECIRNVRKRHVPPPHELDPRIPPAVSKVVLTALERMPSARFQTGADFAEALRRVGRDELGRLPDRRTISAFVKDAGGEELARLTRLIRLGSEGAPPDAMEEVRPGSTMVLGADGSGVARIGTTRTDEMDPASLPKIATVILIEEEDDAAATATEADLDDADLEFLALAEHQTPLLDPSVEQVIPPDDADEDGEEGIDEDDERLPTGQFRKLVAPIAPPTSTGERALAARARTRSRAWLITLGALAVAGLAAVAAAASWRLASEPPAAVLPSSAPAARIEPPAVRSESRPAAPASVERPSEPVRDEATAPRDDAPAPSAEDPAARRRGARRGGATRGREAPATEPASRPTRPRPSEPASAPAARDARPSRPVLLDVRAFDQVAP
ncbi:MAG: protein kinase [Sandaracinaceae bacterium]|nr:protein kinase [Sandaracinaceae bacterium]